MMATRTEVSPIVEAEIVKTIAHWFDRMAAVMSSEGGRLMMQNEFLRQLQASDAATLPTDIIIAAAEAGNEAADAALRIHIADRVNHDRELSAQLRAYNVKSLLRPPIHYADGRTGAVDTWTRDIAICVALDMAADHWQLDRTRSATALQPSAAYFVSLALHQCGVKLKEARVNRIYWERKRLAERVAGSLFPSAF